jgi:NAD(P) transhydrogenase
VEGRDAILPFLDKEITADLVRQMKTSGVDILFNASIEKVEVPEGEEKPLRLSLKSGEILEVDMLLYAAGRSGNTKALNAEKINLKIGKREAVEVNEQYQSNIPHIYAVGDVIGFPALASTSMDQGRIAVGHMFRFDGSAELARIFPYGIYTIPEVSMVGITEEEAAAKNISYAVGRAHHRNLARGKIMGVKDGFLKLVFERETKRVLGVHIIGSLAAEIIHYGLLVVEDGRSLDDLIATVFNYPTLHDLYKYAAYDGLGALQGYKLREL